MPSSIHISPLVPQAANHALQAAALEEVLPLWQRDFAMRMMSFFSICTIVADAVLFAELSELIPEVQSVCPLRIVASSG